jgi:hypothetical protein
VLQKHFLPIITFVIFYFRDDLCHIGYWDGGELKDHTNAVSFALYFFVRQNCIPFFKNLSDLYYLLTCFYCACHLIQYY